MVFKALFANPTHTILGLVLGLALVLISTYLVQVSIAERSQTGLSFNEAHVDSTGSLGLREKAVDSK